MKWLKLSSLVLVVLLLALAAVPFLVSLNDYLPQIEKEVSARLNEPVKIASIRAMGLPAPHLRVDGITVGKTGDIQVGTVIVTPDLFSLLGATKVIRNIEVNGLVLTQKAIEKIPAWTRTDAKPGKAAEPPVVRVQSIRLDDALIKLQKATLGPFDARVKLSASGEPQEASIVTRDGKLSAVVRADGARYLIDASARQWTAPVGRGILFDELTVKGAATMKDANLGEVRARLYGGAVAGKAVVGWHKGVQVKGSATVSRVEIRPLLRALERPDRMSGRLDAKPVFSAAAPSADRLADSLRLETPFNIHDGVLYGVDVSRAATSLVGKDGARGGETRFDELSGHLAVDRGTRRLTRINIASGSLAADGNVTISPRDELSGRINAKVKAGSLGSAGVPLNVAGTLESPLLYPTGGTVAGAAVGTAILGPGLGTSIGARVGQWTESLFGKKEEGRKEERR